MNKDITILVNSCDSYEDTWYPFFKLFNTYWSECKYEIILNTESKKYEFPNMKIKSFQFYKQGEKINYGERMLKHIEYINTDYILVLIDDFFFNDNINAMEIEKCKDWMKENSNIAAFYFSPINDKNNIKSDKYIGYEKRPNVGEYKVNFQAALWRKSDFKKLWKKHETPWTFEQYGTFRTFFDNKEYYVRSKETHNPINYGAKYGEAWNIVAGLWCVDSVNDNFIKNDIIIDYEKRGILKCEIKDLPRDNKKKTIIDEILKIRSIGIKWYIKSYYYRVFRKIRKVLGRKVESDYYEYLKNKFN